MFALTSISYDGDHDPHEQIIGLFYDEELAFLVKEFVEERHKKSPLYVPTTFRMDTAFALVSNWKKP